MKGVMALTLALGFFSSVMFLSVYAGDDATVEAGQKVWRRWCFGCHAGVGHIKLGTKLLAEKYKDTIPAVLDERTDLTGPFIELFVRNGVYFMPRFRKTEISDEDLNALVAYLTRNNINTSD
jgi:mono/diheme cytochrome c family protein